MDPLAKYLRKQVEIYTTDGVTYRGLMLEATEQSIELRGDNGWVSVPMEKIRSVQGRDENVNPGIDGSKSIAANFYFDPAFDPPEKK